MTRRLFYGWFIAGAAFLTLLLTVGVPFYGLPFFYDYFIKEFDSYIDKAAGVIERVRLYPELEKRLMNLKQLCTNASRHIDPSIQAP